MTSRADHRHAPDHAAHEFALGTGTLYVLVDADAPAWPDAPELCRAALAAAVPLVDALGKAKGPWSVTVRLADDATVQRLNREFRHRDKPTNVLSFPSDPEDFEGEEERYAGDIIIALPTVAREAKAGGRPPNHHLQHLALHGLLHLAGYDHVGDGDADTMEALEVRVLAMLNISDPYAAIDDQED